MDQTNNKTIFKKKRLIMTNEDKEIYNIHT